METYQIIDEPKPTALSKYTVDPMWPLLGFMIGGSLFSWLWSTFNSFALNGPNRNKELFTVLIAFGAFIAIYSGASTLIAQGVFDTVNKEYFYLFVTCVELVFCYTIFMFQRDGFEVYEYYEGNSTTAIVPGLLLAFLFGRKFQVLVISLVLGAG